MAGDSYPLERLRVRARGPEDRPVLLFLHGWGSSLDDLESLALPLSDEFRTISLDLPGHGASPPPDTPWGIPEFARLVDRFLRSREPTPVTVVGHSNGGRIALYMASRAPHEELIGRLVLIAPSGITPPRSIGYYLRSWTASLARAPFRLFPEPYRSRGVDWLRTTRLWQKLGSSDYRAAEGVMRETFVRTVTHHLDEEVDGVDVPTLIFWGENDPAIDRVQVETLEDRIPDAGLVVLENAGHFAHIDRTATCLSAIRHFLAHTPSPTPA